MASLDLVVVRGASEDIDQGKDNLKGSKVVFLDRLPLLQRLES